MMKIGIMQPYLFPYIGYWQLINYTDMWIVFDTVQYIEKGWINRNRIIHPNRPEAMYITVPVNKCKRETTIREIVINKNQQYKQRILGQIAASYKKRAPYYDEIYHLVADCLENEAYFLLELNVICMKKICDYLGIEFHYQLYSEMNLTIGEINAPGDWALEIAKAMRADEYINPPGGVDLFEGERFKENGIELSFLQPDIISYDQKKETFIASLSIIDILMFNSKESVKEMLLKYHVFK